MNFFNVFCLIFWVQNVKTPPYCILLPPKSIFIFVILERWNSVSIERELSFRIRKTYQCLIDGQNFLIKVLKQNPPRFAICVRDTVYIKKAIILVIGYPFLSFIRRNISSFVLPNYSC